MKFVSEKKRTHYCGQLGASQEAEEVVVMGWVETRRDHGGLIFIDLRDREGIVQVVLDDSQEAMKTAQKVRNEFVVAVSGKVNLRPEGMRNNKISTGDIEIVANDFEILSEAQTPPFQVSDPGVHENLRLQYRYLDLRTKRLQNNLKVRHQVSQITRRFFSDEGFLEIETPILFKSTPEGARDYLVPSRVHGGSFYALPQSPQTLKQLLMISGYDRYFQIARCFRDEDLRADRQPEFSQIDIEMSFVDSDDIMSVNEKLLRTMWKDVKGVDVGEIPRMTYQQAMDRYGSDKPDTRFGLELHSLNDLVGGSGFKVFEDVVGRGGAVKGFAIPGGADSIARARIDKLTSAVKKTGAKGLVWIKWGADKVNSPVNKFFNEEQLIDLVKACGGKEGDLALIVADDFSVTCAALSFLRLEMGRELGLIDESKDHFLWVTDFPLLEYSPEQKRWVAMHHPFTTPTAEQLPILLDGDESRYRELNANAYDLVCNGHEIAGGSVRIHRSDVQKALFRALGMDEAEVKNKFGFFVEALTYGTPPHAGIAWGLDRLVMILCGTDAIREVIAFPKTAKASCLMSEAPSEVEKDQLFELSIRLAPSLENKDS